MGDLCLGMSMWVTNELWVTYEYVGDLCLGKSMWVTNELWVTYVLE